MTAKEKITPQQELILHILYEHQHLTGKDSISSAEIEMHIADAIFDFGDPEKAIAGIRARCGLAPRSCG